MLPAVLLMAPRVSGWPFDRTMSPLPALVPAKVPTCVPASVVPPLDAVLSCSAWTPVYPLIRPPALIFTFPSGAKIPLVPEEAKELSSNRPPDTAPDMLASAVVLADTVSVYVDPDGANTVVGSRFRE